VSHRAQVIAATLLFLCILLPGSALAENKKHHLGFALGYEKLLSDDLGGTYSGIDFTNSGYGALAYRFSVKRNLDLTLDARSTISKQTQGAFDVTLTNSYFGPGIRLIGPNEGLRMYVQGNFFFVEEQVEAESGGVTISDSENDVGFGVSAGVDIRAGNLLSVPIEANYMYGKPADDISGVGINVGLTFNFGDL
jgi:opacity protein-like surface antigen